MDNLFEREERERFKEQINKNNFNRSFKIQACFEGFYSVLIYLFDICREEIIKKMFYCENKSDFVFNQGD